LQRALTVQRQNVNLPMPNGSSEAVFFGSVDEALLRIARRF
jgi:hypothetical protein